MTRILLRFLVLGAWLWPIATATAQSSSRVAVSLHANSSTPAPGKTTFTLWKALQKEIHHGWT